MKYKHKLLPIVISAALTSGLISCSKEVTIEENLNNVQTLIQQHKVAEAVINLKNILKDDAKNAEARYLLGKLYSSEGKWLIAEKELSRAKSYNYNPELVFPLLAKVYSHLEDSAEIELLLKEVDGNKLLEQSLRYYLGVAFISQGEELLALSEFNNVVGLGAETAYGNLGQAWLYGLKKQFVKAIKIVDKFTDDEIFNAVSLDLKSKTLFAANQMERAARSFESYLNLTPHDLKGRLMYAIALASSNDFEKAEVQADLLLSLSPNNIIVNQIKAQARFDAKDYKEAKKYAENALKGNYIPVIASVVAGISAYQLKQLELAHTHLVSVKDKLSFQHPAQKLLAEIRFQLGYEDDNFKHLSNAPLDELDTKLLSVSAQELFRAGKIEESEKLLQKANQIDPEDAGTLYQLGVVNLYKQNGSAKEFFKLALEKNPELDVASISLIKTLINDKKYNEALHEANEYKKLNPIVANGLIGTVYVLKGEMDKAKIAFNSVVTLDETHIGGLFNLAKIAQYEDNLAEAINYYKKILTIQSRHMPSISSLIQLTLNKQVQAEIETYFKESINNAPELPINRLALSEYYLLHKQLDDAKRVAEEGLKVIPKSAYLLMLLAKVETYMGDYEQALQHLDEAIEDKKDATESAVVYASKSQIFVTQNKMASAIQAQEMAVKVSPNNLPYKLNLGHLYLKNNRVKDAEELLASIPASKSENVGVLELKGRVAFLDQKFERAATFLSQVQQARPTEQVLLELLTALQKTGQQSEAITLINNLNSKSLPLKVQLKQAELYTEIDPDKAIMIYEELSQKTNNYFVLQNNLAWLYLSKNDKQKALKSAEVAILSAAENITVQDTYGVMLLAAGQKSKALAVLKKVMASDNPKASYIVHYAEALIANGNKRDAKKLLSTINKQALSADTLSRYLTASAML